VERNEWPYVSPRNSPNVGARGVEQLLDDLMMTKGEIEGAAGETGITRCSRLIFLTARES